MSAFFDRLYYSVYALRIPRVFALLVFGVMIWAVLRAVISVKYEAQWRWFSAALLAAVSAVILYTLLQRDVQTRNVYLRPFYVFVLAQKNREFLREALMNIALFFPIGLTLPQVLPRHWNNGKRIFWTVLFGMAFSILLESSQFFLMRGTTETDDVICNTLGALWGALHLPIAGFFEKRFLKKELHMELSRTEQLLLQALSASLRGRTVAWDAVSEDEWSELMLLASKHKVLPLIFSAVCDCPAALQWNGRQSFRQPTKQQTVLQVRKTADFLSLYRMMLDEGAVPLVLKGILCRQLYPNGDLRQSSDEDLYASGEDFSKCCEVLRKFGMYPTSDAPEATTEEIGWRCTQSPLYIELHRSFFPKENNAVGELQALFADAVPVSYMSGEEQTVYSLSAHDHLLYLLLHAYKHFIRSGFGIRQVCDIGLWAEKYAHDIDWQLLYRQCESVHALDFSAAIFQIAETDLSVELKLPELWHKVRTDRMPLLKDQLSAGVYGSAELSRAHSASVTQNAVSAHRGYGSGSVLQSVFPPRSALQKQYPILKKCRALLPLIWCRRLISYWKETKGSGKGTVLEPLKIAKERKKLLKYYKAL